MDDHTLPLENEAKSAALLAEYVTPEQLGRHLGWSPRKIREKIREIGAYRLLGNAVIMLRPDVDALLEACKPAPTNSQSSVAAYGGYQELLKLRRRRKAKEEK